MIPYGKQYLDQNDIDSVIEVLRSDFLTQGPSVPAFEKEISNYCCSEHSLAFNSATSALHSACLALGLKYGDYLWTSPNTFVASANCAIYCGAKVDFVDIDLDTYNISVTKLEEKLIEAKKANTLPKIIIPVHFAGQSCDMKRIYELSKLYGFSIIEDASHAIGSKYLNKPVGNCSYSDITVFSFHPVKIITTGEGGVATTNSPKLYEKMKMIRTHGITRDPKLLSRRSNEPWYYEQQTIGFNYRMTDFQAALGSSQLLKLDKFVKERHKKKKIYDDALSSLPIFLPFQSQDCYSSLHLYPIRLNSNETKKSRKDVFLYLKSKEIGVNVHYIPLHTQPFFRKFGFKRNDFQNSVDYYESAISLPLYPKLSSISQKRVINALKDILR